MLNLRWLFLERCNRRRLVRCFVSFYYGPKLWQYCQIWTPFLQYLPILLPSQARACKQGQKCKEGVIIRDFTMVKGHNVNSTLRTRPFKYSSRPLKHQLKVGYGCSYVGTDICCHWLPRLPNIWFNWLNEWMMRLFLFSKNYYNEKITWTIKQWSTKDII